MYVYRLSKVKGSTYKETQIVTTKYEAAREKRDVHGVLFQISPSGQLATFDFTQMLIQVTTSLALVAAATTIVNLMANYVLSYSPYYKAEIYHSTADFSDLRAADAMS